MYGVKRLVEMTEDFNNIKSNWSSKKPTLEDLKNQFKLIQEEVRELEEGLESNDTVEILDGTLDVLVVTVGLLQQLEDAGLYVDAGRNLAKVGTEGDSDGFHLHLSETVFHGTQTDPVNLFHWADSIQPGFVVSGIVGGKQMNVVWQSEINASGNRSEGVIMNRANVLNPAGEISGAENQAYSWNMDVNQRKRIAWTRNSILNQDMWLQADVNGQIFRPEPGKALQWLKNPNGVFEWKLVDFPA